MDYFGSAGVRDTPEPFVSRVRAALSGRTRELERLAVELYARGLSTRDIEDAFTDETGRRLLSRAAVSEITERLGRIRGLLQARSFRARGGLPVYPRRHRRAAASGQRREAVLAAWGIGEDGRKSLLGLMAGSKEDVETVRAFFQDLRARGLGDPLLVVSDGAPWGIRAIEECFPRSARQRCLAHRMRNRPGLGRSLAMTPNSRRGSPPAIEAVACDHPTIGGQHPRRLRQRPAQCALLFRGRFPRAASRTCGCRSRTVASQGRRTSSNGWSSRNGEG